MFSYICRLLPVGPQLPYGNSRRQPLRRSLAAKLFAVLLLLGGGAVLVTSTLGYLQSREALRHSIYDGLTLARRVLSPIELGATDTALPAEGSWHAQVRLDVAPLKVTGYALEVFYP